MRPEAVEIKITFDGPDVDKAIAAFEPMPDRRARRVYFCEDLTDDVEAGTPLLDANLVLRIRTTEGGPDDSTVKLKQGDIMIQRGTNHAWANRGNQPARVALVLVDAEPLGIGNPVVGAASAR